MRKGSLLAIALSLVMLLSACSNNDSADKPTESKDNQSATSTTPEDNKQENNTPSSGNSDSEAEKHTNEETVAVKGRCGPDLEWYYKDNALVIEGSGPMTDFDSYEFTPWGEKGEYNIYQQVRKIMIDKRVTSIGDHAFSHFLALSIVELPDCLERIGDGAFADSNLSEIIIPESVTHIGNDAFRNTLLTEIIIPEFATHIGMYAFCDTPLTEVFMFGSVTYIGINAFSGTQLTEITIPESVDFMGTHALDVENEITVTFSGDIPDVYSASTPQLAVLPSDFSYVFSDDAYHSAVTIKYSSSTFDDYIECTYGIPEWLTWVRQ